MIFAAISTNASAALVTGVAGTRIYVRGLWLTITTANGTIQFQDGATNLSGAATMAAGTPLVLPIVNPDQNLIYYKTSPGNNFNIAVSATGQVSGSIWYDQY